MNPNNMSQSMNINMNYMTNNLPMNIPINMSQNMYNGMNQMTQINNFPYRNNPKEKLYKLILNLNSKMMEVNKIIFQINETFNQLNRMINNNDYLYKMKSLIQNLNSFNKNIMNSSHKIDERILGSLISDQHQITNVFFRLKSGENIMTLFVEKDTPIKKVIEKFENFIENDQDPQYIINNDNLKYYSGNNIILNGKSNETIESLYGGYSKTILVERIKI